MTPGAPPAQTDAPRFKGWRVFVGAVRFCQGWAGQVLLSHRSGCRPVELVCDRFRGSQEEAIADAQALAGRVAEIVAAHPG